MLQLEVASTIALFEACKARNLSTIRTLLHNRTLTGINNINEKKKGLMQLALGAAKVNTDEAKMAHTAEIIDFLCSKGADPDVKDGQGNAAIHVCAKNLNLRAATVLLDRNALVNLTDKSGRMALYLTALETDPDLEFVKMLLDRGASLEGKTLPKLPANARRSQYEVRALIRARLR